jgi:glycosyltransferase involved in cell wall biosynthesis
MSSIDALCCDYLCVTADQIGTETGGGVVTYNESEALRTLGMTAVWSFPNAGRPWGADAEAHGRLMADLSIRPKLAHFYSGTFSRTIAELKKRGTIVTYTAAAHDINVSRQEHEKLGVPFDYPHLNDPEQWARYVRGYLLADLVICPSALSQRVMEGYGCKNVKVIPHGVNLPAVVKPLPKRFACAALGQLCGPDKGVIYLLQAWKMLDYKDATLTLAGHGTDRLLPMVRAYGGGNIYLRGFVKDVSEVYNTCSLLVQPSSSEGFGIEVLEAQAHGRPVICSDGAGACVHASMGVPARSVEALANMIDSWRVHPSYLKDVASKARLNAEKFQWRIIREKYAETWQNTLQGVR